MFQAQVTACAEAWNGEQAASGEPEAWLWGEADGGLERVPTQLPSFLSTGGPSWPSILRNHIQQHSLASLSKTSWARGHSPHVANQKLNLKRQSLELEKAPT